MGWKDWIITGTVVTFAGGQIVPPYTHPLDSKKHYHTHVELHTMVNTVTVSPTNTLITPGTGPLKIEAEERVGVSERVGISD